MLLLHVDQGRTNERTAPVQKDNQSANAGNQSLALSNVDVWLWARVLKSLKEQ